MPASDIEEDSRPVTAVFLRDLQHVPGNRLDAEAQVVPLAVDTLAVSAGAERGFGERGDLEAAEEHLFRVQIVQQLRQPAYENGLQVAALHLDVAQFGLAHATGVDHQGEEAEGRVGE